MHASSAVDWERVDTVLLDMDGTLLDLRFDNWFWGTLVPSDTLRPTASARHNRTHGWQ